MRQVVNPRMAIGGLTTWCIDVVEQRESFHKCMLIRHSRGEDGKVSSAIAPRHIPQHLVIGSVLFNDEKDIFDKGWFSDMPGNGNRCGMRVDVLLPHFNVRGQVPVIVVEDLLAELAQLARIWLWN